MRPIMLAILSTESSDERTYGLHCCGMLCLVGWWLITNITEHLLVPSSRVNQFNCGPILKGPEMGTNHSLPHNFPEDKRPQLHNGRKLKSHMRGHVTEWMQWYLLKAREIEGKECHCKWKLLSSWYMQPVQTCNLYFHPWNMRHVFIQTTDIDLQLVLLCTVYNSSFTNSAKRRFLIQLAFRSTLSNMSSICASMEHLMLHILALPNHP